MRNNASSWALNAVRIKPSALMTLVTLPIYRVLESIPLSYKSS